MTYTDFTKYSHADLRKMAQALDPGAVMAAGDPWRKAATTLKEIRKTLTNVSTEAATAWDGTTSDSFHTSMLTLAANINDAAAYANDAANTLHNMSEAMATAKRTMPEEPDTWDKVKDKVGDFFSTEDDHIQVADAKKAEAAAVMQTLAMHYRVATPALKPPPMGPDFRDKPDQGAQNDPNGPAAVAAAVFSGTSFGVGGTSVRSASAPPPQRSRPAPATSSSTSTPRSVATPTDSGVKGGTPQAPPKSPTTTTRAPETGVSGTPASRPSGSVPSPVTSGTQTSGLNVPTPPTLPANGPGGGGGGQTNITPVSPAAPSTLVGPGLSRKEFAGGAAPAEGFGPRGGRSVGSGGEVYPGIGAGAREVAGARQVGGTLARPGGAVRESMPPGAGARGNQAFTEGGSGLGARNRLTSEPGTRGVGAMAPGIPMSEAQRRKQGRGKDGKRPDYLIEDEETWASDKPANPNVVE